jgi:hypothetical protein
LIHLDQEEQEVEGIEIEEDRVNLINLEIISDQHNLYFDLINLWF